MRLSARLLRPRGHQPAREAPIDQSSRRMLGRRAAHAVRPEIILQRHNLAGNSKRNAECCDRRAGQELAHAGRHEHAFVAVNRRGSLRGTARHVGCQLIRHGRHRIVAIADIDASGVVPAITGRASGARISPAIIKVASSRRMVIRHFTRPKSHGTYRIDSPSPLTTP